MDEKQRAQIVAQQNDAFRKWWGAKEGLPPSSGRVFLTVGVQDVLLDLAAETLTLLKKVADFDKFEEDNDPWGERDFGAFDFGGQRMFWKIDLYNSDALVAGSKEPADPEQTYRLMTIMLASEY